MRDRRMECKKASNLAACACTYPCRRRGICCECVSHHRARGELPACYFTPEDEKTYDRSIGRYMRSAK